MQYSYTLSTLKNIGARLVSGSAFRVAVMSANVVASFYLIPFLVHGLGSRWYGMWILACSFMPYYSLLDLGFSAATQRFIAHALAKGDREEVSEVLSTTLGLYSVAGVLAVLLGFGLAATAPFFVQGAEEIPVFRVLVFVTALNVALSFPAATFHGLLSANLRFDIDGYLQLGKLAVRTLATVFAIKQGYGILSLAWITLAADSAERALRVYLALRVSGGIRVGRPRLRLDRIKSLFGYGTFAFASRMAELVRFSAGNMVVAKALSLTAVSTFSISVRLTEYFIELMASLVGLLMPVFTRFHGAGEERNLREKFLMATRIAVLAGACSAGGILVFGPQFIRLWLGEEFLAAYAPMAVLVAGILFVVIQNPAVAVVFAVDRHRAYAVLQWAEVGAALALSLLLVRPLGILGVAAGTAVPLIASRLLYLPSFVARITGVPLPRYYLETGRILAVAALGQVPIWLGVQRLRLDGYAVLLGTAALLYLPYVALLARFLLPREDRESLARSLPLSGWLRG